MEKKIKKGESMKKMFNNIFFAINSATTLQQINTKKKIVIKT